MKVNPVNVLIMVLSMSFSTFILLPMAGLNVEEFWLPSDQYEDVVAEIAIVDARIWTGNSYEPWAQALAVIEDTIAAIGRRKQINDLITDETLVISAEGGMVVPGFIDSHIHMFELGTALKSVKLRDAMTKSDFITRIKDFANTLKPGEWILGFSWDHENWGGELPSKEWIDSVTQYNPVWIGRIDGHMGLANSLALEKANLTAEVKDVEGGTIVRNSNGELTGIFKDNAMPLVSSAIPEPDLYEKAEILKLAMDEVARNGVTSVIHVEGGVEVFKESRRQGLLKTRAYVAAPLQEWRDIKTEVVANGYGDDWIKVGGLKGFVDGSLGSHTALFKEPYTDLAEDTGLLLNPWDSLYHQISSADEADLQVMVHAIGDSAITTLLDIFELVSKENGPRDRRFKMEHAQHVDPADFARFGEWNVIASMQPYHAIDDGRWAERFIGPQRIRSTYAFKSMLDAGVVLAFGSDAPVAPVSPLEGIYAAVTRRTLDGKNPRGWIAKEKITVEEALMAYTWGGAFATHELDRKGTLEVGKLADFVILNQDITRIEPRDIKAVQVMRTFVGGNMVYHRLDL